MGKTPTVDAAVLLEHGEWLRALAARVAGGGDEADDLVQETWMAAVQQAPATDRPLRPWLAQVLRNLASLRRRARGRRDARERTAEALREAPPSPEALLARAVLMRQLAALVVELPETLRTTLLLRYEQGLTAERIAELHGVPAGTVRWRLKSALDRLRDGLDAHEGGERERWRRALLPLPVAGGTAMAVTAKKSSFVVYALVALLLAGVGLGLWLGRRAGKERAAAKPAAAEGQGSDSPSGGAPQHGSHAPGKAAAPGAAAGATDPFAAAPASGRPAVAVDDPSALGVVEGRVINWSTGAGVAGVELSFAASGETTTTTITSGEDGRFELAPASPRAHTLVAASKPGFLPYAPEWGQSPVRFTARPGRRVRDVVVFLFPAVDYHGVVLDPDGKPVAGASVRLLGAPQGEQALELLEERYTTGADGRFLFHAPDGAVFEASHAGFAPARAVLDGKVAVSHSMEIRLGPGGGAAARAAAKLGSARLAGRVVDERGEPVAGAQLRVGPAPSPPPAAAAPAAPAAVPLPPLFAITGDDGRFALAGLDPGDVEVTVTHDEHAGATVRTRAGRSDVEIVLAGGGALAGRVVGAGGVPVPAFTVLVLARDGLARRQVATRSVVDADGRFELPHLPPGDYLVVAGARGHADSPETPVTVAAGARAEVIVTLARGGAIAGVVSGEHGKPLPWARVMLEGQGGGATILPANAGTVTDERGAFMLTGVPAGAVTVRVAAGEHHMRLIGGLEVRDGAVTGPISVELRPTAPGEAPQLELVGIGVRLAADGERLLVQEVIPGGGAADAGLLAGDAILAVDGREVGALGFDAAIAAIRGAEGSRVRLLLRRGDDTLELAVERRRIKA